VHRRYILLYIQQDATLHSLFISGNCYLSRSWKSWNAVPTFPRSRQVTVTVWQIPDVVDTVVCAPDDGWRYHPKHVEPFPDISKLCNVASCWIYSRIHNICTSHTQSWSYAVIIIIIIIHLQRWKEVLEATNLKVIVTWKQSLEGGWQHRLWIYVSCYKKVRR
jgi:hypothetical protein